VSLRVAVVKFNIERLQKYIYSQNIIVLLFISEFESIHVILKMYKLPSCCVKSKLISTDSGPYIYECVLC